MEQAEDCGPAPKSSSERVESEKENGHAVETSRFRDARISVCVAHRQLCRRSGSRGLPMSSSWRREYRWRAGGASQPQRRAESRPLPAQRKGAGRHDALLLHRWEWRRIAHAEAKSGRSGYDQPEKRANRHASGGRRVRGTSHSRRSSERRVHERSDDTYIDESSFSRLVDSVRVPSR